VARGLRKRYRDIEAVKRIDLTIRAGEIFAFLGPNGAGFRAATDDLRPSA
jgi:ABC-2 type transport system ATP-binding protein